MRTGPRQLVLAALVLGASAACLCATHRQALAADAAGPRAPDEVDARLTRGADLTLPELLRACGGMTYVMLALSLAVVAIGVYSALECRRSRIFPRAAHGEVLARLASRDRAGALAAVEGSSTFYGRGARAALARPEGASPDELRSLMRASGDRDATVLRGRLALLAQLGAVAALAGLLGTLVGILQAFGAAAREVYEPVLAYAAVFKSLVTSFAGLVLATIAVLAYFVLRHGLERALADAGYAFEEVIAAVGWASARAGESGAGDGAGKP